MSARNDPFPFVAGIGVPGAWSPVESFSRPLAEAASVCRSNVSSYLCHIPDKFRVLAAHPLRAQIAAASAQLAGVPRETALGACLQEFCVAQKINLGWTDPYSSRLRAAIWSIRHLIPTLAVGASNGGGLDFGRVEKINLQPAAEAHGFSGTRSVILRQVERPNFCSSRCRWKLIRRQRDRPYWLVVLGELIPPLQHRGVCALNDTQDGMISTKTI